LYKKKANTDDVFVNPAGNCYFMPLGRLTDGTTSYLIFYCHFIDHATFRARSDFNFEALGVDLAEYSALAFSSNPNQIWRSEQTASNYQEEVINDYFKVEGPKRPDPKSNDTFKCSPKK